MILSVRMHYEQESAALMRDPSRADCVPTLFFRFAVDAVRIDEAAFVLQSHHRQFE